MVEVKPAPMADVRGKTAFITGGANGIGLGIARALVAAGANVVIADIRESSLTEAKASLGADDQVETVFMRILREAGPRGLACLYAESEVVRPFLDINRSTLERYVRRHGIRYVDDPSNKDRRHLRNRVRLDILPSILRKHPAFADELLTLARRAADWRRSVEDILPAIDATPERDGALRVSRSSLRGYDADSLRVLWPALAARASVVMDRRGTHRAAEFTMKGATGGAIQLSGGVEIVMSREDMLLRRAAHIGRVRNASRETRA